MDDEAEMRVPLRKFLAFMRRMSGVELKRKPTKRNLLKKARLFVLDDIKSQSLCKGFALEATATWKKDLADGVKLSEDEAGHTMITVRLKDRQVLAVAKELVQKMAKYEGVRNCPTSLATPEADHSIHLNPFHIHLRLC